MTLKLILGSLATLTILGCTTPAAPPAASGPAPARPAASICNAEPAQFAVGKTAGANVVEEARQRSGADMARLLRPNQAVTMEFNAQRLNLDVDTSGVITRVRCG
jgi:23S rRNA-/tRNA-specific pseudouridylate synthase